MSFLAACACSGELAQNLKKQRPCTFSLGRPTLCRNLKNKVPLEVLQEPCIFVRNMSEGWDLSIALILCMACYNSKTYSDLPAGGFSSSFGNVTNLGYSRVTDPCLVCRRVELLHCNAVHTLLEAVPFVSWSPKSGSSKASREADLSRIFSSKKLTHLSLADAPEVSVMPLDRFQQLKSLHLKDCSEMPLSVAQVEAMKELQKLTIEDSTPLDAEGYPLSLAGDKFGKNLIRSMAVHVMLSVRKLLPRGAYSGECALFKLGMA